MEGEEEKKSPDLVAFLRRDALYIIVIVLVAGFSIYIGTQLDRVMEECNENYNEYIKENCVCYGGGDNGIKDNSQNTQGPSGPEYEIIKAYDPRG